MPKIKTEGHTETWNALSKASDDAGEAKDCAVKAVAAVTGQPYEAVRAVLAECGRVARDGTYRSQTQAALKAFGFKGVWVDPQYFISQYRGVHKKVRCVTSHHPERFPVVWKDGNSYLMFVTRSRGHILGIVDGVNHDWSRGRRKHCYMLWQVVPLTAKGKAVVTKAEDDRPIVEG